MNERIQELVSQLDNPVATIGNWGRVEWADNVYPQLGDKMYAAIDLQKFAELIVQECCSKLLDMNEKTKGDHNYYKHASLKIKEHFGVE